MGEGGVEGVAREARTGGRDGTATLIYAVGERRRGEEGEGDAKAVAVEELEGGKVEEGAGGKVVSGEG